MGISLSGLIKKLTILNTIFGAKASKLAGVRDRGTVFTDSSITFDASTDTITCLNTASIPSWLKTGKYFRANLYGYTPVLPPENPGPNEIPNIISNHYVLYQVKEARIVSGHLVIDVDPSTPIVNSSGPSSGTIDGRIWAVTNDQTICRAGEMYDTIYNVHNQASTGLKDGSGISIPLAEHYHAPASIGPIPPTPTTNMQIVTNEYGLTGNKMYAHDIINNVLIPIGPLPVIDDCGNVVWFDDPDDT